MAYFNSVTKGFICKNFTPALMFKFTVSGQILYDTVIHLEMAERDILSLDNRCAYARYKNILPFLLRPLSEVKG